MNFAVVSLTVIAGLLASFYLLLVVSRTRKTLRKTRSFVAFIVTTVPFLILGGMLSNITLADSLFGEYIILANFIFIILMVVVLLLVVYTYEKQVKKSYIGKKKEKFWLLKFDPERFRIFDWWQDHPNILTDSWLYDYYKYRGRISALWGYFRQGDKVAIWVQGAVPGVYALGEVTKKISRGLGNPLQKPYQIFPCTRELYLEFKYTKKFFSKPLTREHEYLRRFPLSPNSSIEQIRASLWGYIEEKLGLKDPDLLKKKTLSKEVISHSAWLERTKKSAFWSLLVGTILFVSGLALIIVGLWVFGGEGIYNTIAGVGLIMVLWGVVGLLGWQIKGKLAKARP